MKNKYTPIIGLETHVELKTNSKMFCGCSADYFGKEPNTHTCPVCLGLPGALPVPNKKAIDWCIKISLALNCKINEFSKFDRKNYFYPDLAKGYQISQYDLPFGYEGCMVLSNGKKVRIRRVHMEEDTGKLTHEGGNSLIDFNRSGLPLVEIVTEPDFHDALDVKEYLQKLQQIVRYLDVSNADMEKGDMRLEPNISLTLDVKKLPNYKVEVKNINSFKFVEKAINFEVIRQQELLEKGERPAQETRGWDSIRNKTFSQRSKEDAQDYRYFPEPDIPPIVMSKEQIEKLRKSLPELPDEKEKRFIKLGFSPYNAMVSTATVSRAEFIENTFNYAKEQNLDAMGTVNYALNRRINDIPNTTYKTIVEDYKKQSTVQTVDDSELEKIIKQVIEENEKAVTDYKSGKETVIMFLVGQVMKKVGKKIDAQMVKEKLQNALQK
jgi:aspartyl-tRNA(Asn)/glutamyl-tRNA(Gln) amidotransferase subunit B